MRIPRRPLHLALLALAWPLAARAQGAAPRREPPPRPGHPRKVAQATRVTGVAPHVDGRLDDAAWAGAVFFSDFIQKEPVEGAQPTERTEVAIVYDDEALYVAARLYKNDLRDIQRTMSRRDGNGLGQSEHIWVSFDTHFDHRTAYSFGITASGVRMDWYHPTDNEYNLDFSFDPVWEAHAQIDSLGWTAEMRIPFSQLRFPPHEEQLWGFNVDRWIPSRNEDDFWIPVPRNETGWSSHMGELRGISGIRPSRRLEVLPYAASNATLESDPDPANPFDADGRTAEVRVGGDLKMGVGPNLTVEATVNPDFGQVEADPAVVNLSQFEVFFPERRPFFVEGSRLLQGNGASYFYSRRIGAPPATATGDYVSQPDASTIISAAKLTGRLPSGLSVGALAAVTAREWADTYTLDSAGTGGSFGRAEIAAPTGYGVARLQQEFGANASTVGVMLTGVARDVTGSPLAATQARRALTGGLDWNLRFARGYYSFSGFAGFSHVTGDALAIEALQLAPQRYYQRPDQTYVAFDPSRTSLAGYVGGFTLSKNSGRHWLWDVSASTESPGLELNDAGRISTADGNNAGATLTYRENRPGRVFRTWSLSGYSGGEWNYALDRQFYTYRADFNGTFRNQWQLTLTAWQDQPSQDERLTRGGPSMGTPRSTVGIVRLASNFASTLQWSGRIYYGETEIGGLIYRLSGGLTLRRPRWLFSATPNYLYSRNAQQYVQEEADPLNTTTYGARYVFATVAETDWSVQFRLNYAFTPDLTLEGYAEPFVASGSYAGFGELAAPRRMDLRVYGQAPGTSIQDSSGAWVVRDRIGTTDSTSFLIARPDFNVTSWRTNLVLRWEWRRGSTLYVVWQADRGSGTGAGTRVRMGDLFDGFRAPGPNFFAVKVSYWLPVS